jgi:hypothetical protein
MEFDMANVFKLIGLSVALAMFVACESGGVVEDTCVDGNCTDALDLDSIQATDDKGGPDTDVRDVTQDHGDPDIDLDVVDEDLDTDGEEPEDPCLVSPKPFGCPCEKQTDCDSGWCVLMPDESKRCTVTCIENCPEQWNCEQVLIASDPMWLCVPFHEPLCNRKCLNDGPCGYGASCVPMESSQYCLAPCETDEDCPLYPPVGVDYAEGLNFYQCLEIENWDGSASTKQCVPISGHCKCAPDIDLMNDPEHCGTCETECGVDPLRPEWESNAVWACNEGHCKVSGCNAGFVNLNGLDSDGCEYECTYLGADDLPDADMIDRNCDGIDGDAANSVFVDVENGDDEDNILGDMRHPFKTINAAINFSFGKPNKPPVLVSKGQYQEQIVMRDGVSIYGAYDAANNWSRDLARNRTSIVWAGQEPLAVRAVIAENITSQTVIQGFNIRAQGSVQQSGSSYGIFVFQVNSGLVIEHNEIQSGNGMDGKNGLAGKHGFNGETGGVGSASFEYNKCSVCICNIQAWSTMRPGTGGASPCGATGGTGGIGGKRKEAGFAGEQGKVNGGAGGIGGCAQESASCKNGRSGSPGSDGVNGSNGGGGLAVGALNPNGLWVPGSGANGDDGQDGKGGGGGGGGGGDTDDWCRSAGGAGGGGGGGGCAGTGGEGGTGGGGSFGIFVTDGKPIIRNNVIMAGYGGNGGQGGLGGEGGNGGNGGLGGTQTEQDPETLGAGGNGGKGGKGGNGGAGGGGAGGASFAIYILGASSDPICTDNELNPGGGGLGGQGGAGAANKGQDGPAGRIFGPTPSCSN